MNPFSIGVVTIGGSPVALSTLAAGNPVLLKKLTIFNAGSGVIYLGSHATDLAVVTGETVS